jgi:tRNA threonylcarbamoyladenosine biosynthesis protein TsaE
LPLKSIHLTDSSEATEALGKRYASQFLNQKIFLFGDLGVGKTTFLRGFAKGLRIKSKIKSPTFVGEHLHIIDSRHSFLHLDFYRAEKLPLETIARLQEMFAVKNTTVAIEWSEKLPRKMLPKKRVEIHFQDCGGEKREITFVVFP